jgi:hypothetical protein
MRNLIYFLVLGLVSLSSLAGASPTARDIRRVDSKNFSFAWNEEMVDGS